MDVSNKEGKIIKYIFIKRNKPSSILLLNDEYQYEIFKKFEIHLFTSLYSFACLFK